MHISSLYCFNATKSVLQTQVVVPGRKQTLFCLVVQSRLCIQNMISLNSVKGGAHT